MVSDEAEREEIERDFMIATVLSASTPEQCRHAAGLISAWSVKIVTANLPRMR